MERIRTRRIVILDAEPPTAADRFVTYTGGEHLLTRLPILHMPRATWEDLGRPATATVTIDPGDHVNQVWVPA